MSIILDHHGNPYVEEKNLTPTQVLEGVQDGGLYLFDNINTTDTINKSYVIYRGINLLSQAIAQVPVVLYRGDQPLLNGTLPGSFDFFNPNSEMSLQELLYASAFYYFYRGELFNRVELLEGSRNNVLGLYPINPSNMEDITSDGEIVGWKWVVSGVGKSIPIEQVIFIRAFNPDGLRGLGPVDVIKNEIQTDISATEYNKRFFENFGKIGGVLTDKEGKARVEDMKVLVNQYNTQHQGKHQAHKVLGLPGGIDFKELGQTMKEMEFLESRKDIRDRILQILGIPKAVFGVSEDVNYANALTHDKIFWSKTIKPNLLRFQNKYNQQFFNKYYKGYSMQFDVSTIEELFTDYKIQAETAKIYQSLGFTLNEVNIRFELGMDEVTDDVGDMRLLPSTMVPATDYTDPIVPEPVKSITEPVEKRSQAPRGLQRRQHILQRNTERSFHSKMRRHFSDQLPVIKGIVKDNGRKAINSLDILVRIRTFLSAEKEVLQEVLEPLYVEGSEQAAVLAQTALGTTINPRASERIVGDMVNKIRGIEDRTYNLIRGQVLQSVEAGETLKDLSKRIDKVYNFNKSRSRTIARTESAVLINRSTDEEYQKQGVKQKRWVSNADARPTHKSNNDRGVVPFNYMYDNGMAYPGDPSGSAGEVVNCRCALVPVIDVNNP